VNRAIFATAGTPLRVAPNPSKTPRQKSVYCFFINCLSALRTTAGKSCDADLLQFPKIFFIKTPVLRHYLEEKHVSNVQKMRRIFMKKLVLCVLSVALLSIGMVGCGNSPDGDKQKLSAPVSSPAL
jgi:hypothetical protein